MRPTTKTLPFFVYGTLRAGQGNYSWALDGKTVSEQPATLLGGSMYDQGSFPYVIREDGQTEGKIVGDLMEVADENYAEVLADLDHLEGYNPNRSRNHYNRVVVQVTTADGEVVDAYTYVADESMRAEIRRFCPEIPSGDWVADGRRSRRF